LFTARRESGGYVRSKAGAFGWAVNKSAMAESVLNLFNTHYSIINSDKEELNV
jgi:hypothetical protein